MLADPFMIQNEFVAYAQFQLRCGASQLYQATTEELLNLFLWLQVMHSLRVCTAWFL